MTFTTSTGMLGVAAAAAALAFAGAPAAAQGDSLVERISLDRAAVTPASAQQAPRALDRLGRAAMEACGASSSSLHDHQRAVRGSACWHDTMGDVVARIDNPYLTTAYQRRVSVEVVASRGGSETHAR